jgi:hypothetical protein
MKIFLDINVVLDVFLARSPWLADSAASRWATTKKAASRH